MTEEFFHCLHIMKSSFTCKTISRWFKKFLGCFFFTLVRFFCEEGIKVSQGEFLHIFSSVIFYLIGNLIRWSVQTDALKGLTSRRYWNVSEKKTFSVTRSDVCNSCLLSISASSTGIPKEKALWEANTVGGTEMTCKNNQMNGAVGFTGVVLITSALGNLLSCCSYPL